MTSLRPIYAPALVRKPAFHLRYAWSGWPSSRSFPSLPSPDFLNDLDEQWEADGIRRLETSWSGERIQFVFSVRPQVSPELFVNRVKGRLQHHLRKSGLPSDFSRKVAFRTIGRNRTADVANYIRGQVHAGRFVDPAFAAQLRQFTVSDPTIDLSLPTATVRGRYWYNLHVVLVVAQRGLIRDLETLRTIDRWCPAICNKMDAGLAHRSLMPDHLHLAIRGNIQDSPEEIALSLMNNLAFAIGQKAIWQPSYYAGTFGEYDMNAVRQND